MTDVLFLLLLLFVWIPCGCYAGVIADGKGHDGIAWFFGGVCFGPMALLAMAGLEDRKLRRYIRLMAENQGVDLSEAKPGVKAEPFGKAEPFEDVAKDFFKKARGR